MHGVFFSLRIILSQGTKQVENPLFILKIHVKLSNISSIKILLCYILRTSMNNKNYNQHCCHSLRSFKLLLKEEDTTFHSFSFTLLYLF